MQCIQHLGDNYDQQDHRALTLLALVMGVACQPIPFDQSGETNPEPIPGCEDLDTGDTGWDTGEFDPCE